MLYREIIAVCSQIHTKHTNTLCGQNVGLLNVAPGDRLHSGQGVALTTQQHMELRIKKEQSYNSIAFLCFHSLFKGKTLPFIFGLTLSTVNTGETMLFPVLCASRREPEGHLAAGGLRVLGLHKHHGLRFVQAELLAASPRGIDHSANVYQLSLFCGTRTFVTSIWHTGTASKETSGGISRTGAVQVIILKVCSAHTAVYSEKQM